MEISGLELFVPAVVAALVVALRQFSSRLDGPAAYWWSIGLNIVGQVAAAVLTGADTIDPAVIGQAAALGLGTGAVVSPGIAATGKRLGAAKVVKPRA